MYKRPKSQIVDTYHNRGYKVNEHFYKKKKNII